jgi:integrative and conjugative element protein (TIGR02256 family)
MIGVVRLSAAAAASIVEYTTASADGSETGGILLGYDETELGEMMVMHAGDAGPNAERRADFFQRDLAYAQQHADTAYEETCSYWIGEWHTHPDGHLAPSSTDLRTYHDLLRDPELLFQTFLALIVGPGADGWTSPTVAAWTIESQGATPAQLLTAHQVELLVEQPEDDPGTQAE